MGPVQDKTPTGKQPWVLSCQEVVAKNGKGDATILFIHGAHSSGEEWSTISEYLDERYHLLLPDLPAHGKSKNIGPFGRELSIRLLADLIRERARNGKAHIVGHSLGARLAVDLATNHPDLVDVVFVSGYGAFSSPGPLAYGLWIQNHAVNVVPTSITRWLMDGIEISALSNTSLALSKDIANSMCLGEDGWPPPWKARSLIIAAGKSGIMPTADNPEAARKLRDIGRKANDATVAFTHPGMRHPWNLQDPKLYAETVREWIELGTVHSGFKML